MTAGRGHASTEPGADLAALVRHRHETLTSHLDAARDGDVEGVHQARVASRRLREVVPVLGAGLQHSRRKTLRRQLRELTRALGPVRELDVALGMIDELDLADAPGQQLRSAWRARLQARRRVPARALRKALAARRRTRLDRHLTTFAAVRASSDDRRWRLALATRLERRASDLRSRIEQTGALFHVEPLHDVRIASKKLRYALELTGESRLAGVSPMLRTLKKVQDVLGRLHDVDVLLRLLHELPAVAPGEPLHAPAMRVTTALEHESRWLHARYLRRRAALSALADATHDTLVARVRAPRPRPSHHALEAPADAR